MPVGKDQEMRKGAEEIAVVGIVFENTALKAPSEYKKLVPPNPDVAIDHPTLGLIGVEVTRLNSKDKGETRSEAELCAILRDAAAIASANTRPHFHVSIEVDPVIADLPIKAKNRGKNAERLAEFCAKNAVPGGLVEIVAPELDGLPAPVSKIIIDGTKPDVVGWTMSAIGRQPPMASYEQIAQTIAKKSRRIRDYQCTFTRHWLVIHNGIGSAQLSASRDVPWEIDKHHFPASGFDRVYLVHFGKVIELLQLNGAAS